MAGARGVTGVTFGSGLISSRHDKPISLRPFRAADQAAARLLVEEGLGEHFGFVDRTANPDVVDITSSYATTPNAFFVAERDGTLVGTTGLIVKADTGRLVRVAVARDCRRLGIATLMMNYVAAFARRAGLAKLVVHTQPEWADAMGFYKSHGFVPCGRDSVDVHLHRLVAESPRAGGAAELPALARV
jgi:N-acetylglutamate synthase-like GNAT family acetyltransferase